MLAALILAGLTGILPPATATKTASVVSDPVNGTLSPKAIPGALVDYTITVTNASGAVIDSGSLAVIDAIPAQEKFCVGDLGVSGSGPISFSVVANLTGLAYTFISLSSATDDVDFSNTNGATWSYTPSPDATGCDAAVTTIRVHPHGVTAVAGAFNVRFRVRLK